jgi:hypothetical protein
MAARLPGILPSRDDLGQMPSARTGRPVGRMDVDAATATGRGVVALGEGIGALGAALQQKQDQDEEQEVQRRLLEFEQAQSRALDDSRRTLTGDPAGFADRTRATFTDSARGLFAGAREAGLSPRALRRLDTGLFGLRERLQTTAFTAEMGQRGAYGEQWTTERLNALAQDYQAAPDDEARQRILDSAESTVALGRRTYGFSTEIEQRLRGTARQMVEHDILSRPDGYSALMELRSGDPRVRAPSTGEISDTQLQRLARRPGMTPEQLQAAVTGLRTQAGEVSRLIREGLTEGVSLTQAQHDALVSFGLARGADALQELMPSVNSSGPGRLSSLAQAMRSPGGLTAQEQPAPGAPPTGGPQADLGSISARYESGGRGVGFISSGQGDPGGPSYGIHQLSGASSMGAFLASPEGAPYRGEFGTMRPMTPEFNAIYQRLAEADPEGFAAAQRAFYTRTHYEPARAAAETAGFDVSSRAIQEALFSIGVQHGGARTIIARAAGQMGPNASVEDQVRALYEARTTYVQGLSTLPEGTRQSVLSRYQREMQDVLRLARDGTSGAPAPSTDPRIAELAELVQGNAPAGRYASLPADRRRWLIEQLSRTLRPEVAAEIERDIESIRQTGEPRQLPDGSTWISRAPQVLPGMQAARIAQRVAEARAQFQAIYGLTDMTPADMSARLDEIDPVGDADDGTTPRTRRFVAGVIRRITDLRRTDPALWASGTYVVGEGSSQRVGENGQIHTVPAQDDLRVQPATEVSRAYQLLARRYPHLQIQVGADGEVTYQPEPGAPGAGQSQPQRLLLTDQRLTPQDRQLIIEARVEAMARVGIPEGDRYIIRADEAAQILRLPVDLTRLTASEFTQHLRAATDRATELFGPRYARAAFDAALHFRRLSGERLEGAQGASLILGRRLAALDREEALWSTGAPPVGSIFSSQFGMPMGPPSDGIGPMAGISGVPGFSMPSSIQGIPTPAPTPAPGTLPSGPPLPVSPQPRATGVPGVSQQAWPRPSPEMVSRLARLPAMQEEFDRTFGPGTAAHYLSLLGQSQAPRR